MFVDDPDANRIVSGGFGDDEIEDDPTVEKFGRDHLPREIFRDFAFFFGSDVADDFETLRGIAGDNSGRGGGFEAFELVGIRDDDGLDVLNDIAASGAEDIQGGLGGFAGGCQAGVLEWISPSPSEVVSGLYTLKATVNVPEMGFFRYDYAPINDPSRWNAISAGNLPVIEGTLGPLATTEIENGDYILRLEVLSKTNEAWAPCDVSIRIMNETEE